MRSLILLSCICWSILSEGQIVESIGFQLGPKREFYRSTTGNVEVLPLIDAGFCISAFKGIGENWELKLSLAKRDYSAKYKVVIFDQNTQRQEHYFDPSIYPGFTSYQLSLQPCYTKYLSQESKYYISAGLALYAHKELSRTGVEESTEVLLDENDQILSSLEMRTFANKFDGGNYFFRFESGWVRALSPYLSFDVSIYGTLSSLDHQSFKLEFLDNKGGVLVSDKLVNRGIGYGLNIGVRINLES